MEEATPQTMNWGPPDAGASVSSTDAQLLRRFNSDRDQAAFAELVARHGPLVLSVCRRVLGTVQDAEDAFQAAFLVLARKAGAIRDPNLLGNWLYGVASRIARKARVSVSKRQMHEKQVRFLPSLQAPPSPESDDVALVLDEELARLPQKYRVALVLCYLEGKTNEEAARLLQWPTGTVKGRLARARDLLRNRLVRRGLRASALLLASTLAGARAHAAAVPSSLADTTTRAGVGYAAGGTGVAVASPQAVRLAEALLGSVRRARILGLTLVLAVFLAGAVGWSIGSGAIGREARSAGEDPASCHPLCNGHTAPDETGSER
jgi:RNA polymerase sigma factor (sigma-70 family)